MYEVHEKVRSILLFYMQEIEFRIQVDASLVAVGAEIRRDMDSIKL